MKKDKRNVVLYEGMAIPLWLLLFMPRAWLYILPALFVLCSVALIALFCVLDRRAEGKEGGVRSITREDIRQSAAKWRKCIIPVWLISFIARMLCAGTVMLISYVPGVLTGEESWWSLKITEPMSANPFASIPALLITACCIAFTAYIIFWLCYRIAFGRLPYEEDELKWLAVRFALFTAPYLLLVPSEWFWK